MNERKFGKRSAMKSDSRQIADKSPLSTSTNRPSAQFTGYMDPEAEGVGGDTGGSQNVFQRSLS